MDSGNEIPNLIPVEIRELMLEEQTSMTDVHALKVIAESRARVAKALKEESIVFHSYLEGSDNFLRSHLGSRIHLVILYADIVNSTRMSTVLPLEKLTTILQIFAQEMTVVVANNEGYILKYVGDAIIVYFPVPTASEISVSARRAVMCALHMLIVVEHGINAILKQSDFPEVHIKIGIDSGENAIIEYGSSGSKSHIDILGYPMNVTAKITSLAQADHILVGDTTYRCLDLRTREKLTKLGLKRQDYINYLTGDAYIISSFGLQS
ncbi:MAG TPA: adenylate/guanylate cyclase domain-containing protein [Candidatus Nitrosopolaris sp.]|nr:adenylate/guanylate cyclase domain-containing protein [Candidatus Nitrosopolaris sp.]